MASGPITSLQIDGEKLETVTDFCFFALPVNNLLSCLFSIQKMKIIASGPITWWEIDGETVETVSHFIFGGSKITADDDCSHEIKNAYSLEGKLWPT